MLVKHVIDGAVISLITRRCAVLSKIRYTESSASFSRKLLKQKEIWVQGRLQKGVIDGERICDRRRVPYNKTVQF